MSNHGIVSHLLTRTSPTTLLLSFLALSLTTLFVYKLFLDPLRNIPGPWICRLTSLWSYYHSYIGDECTRINALHDKYGPVVRIAPNEVIFADGAALAPIYSERGGFMKAACYKNFDLDGHATIFSTRDPVYRGKRSKAVVSLFSMGSIRDGNARIEECVDGLMRRLEREAERSRKTSAPVNVLNLSRSLALDAVSAYLFGRTYGGTSEEDVSRMSASGFVDALVAFGRFFFLPHWLFLALEMGRQKFMSGVDENQSVAKVGDFSQKLVQEASQGEDDGTYQGRLLKAGISAQETEIQCNDLIFAGTDSTGTNFATILWNLAKNPEIYATLGAEVAKADSSSADGTYNPQTLPYLDAVVREGLRISMANPTRFPRVVPASGFTFISSSSPSRTYHLPPGTLVGLQPYTLHFNQSVYRDPFAFKPERWLQDATPEMHRDWIPFGLGARQCIARNLATSELFLATRAVARTGILEGAKAVGERIEILEWFNSHIKGDRVDLVWE